jgi:hypothetical protein
MLIYAALSSHGYGHGSRTASVLTELAALRPDWRLVVSSGLPASFLQLALGSVPFEHRPCQWDVGVVQADALGSDGPGTLAALAVLDRDLPGRLQVEAAWLRAQGEPALVLGDVPPAAALLARGLGLPLVWLASFGWDSIYTPMGGPFLERAERCRELYAQGDLLLHCPLSLPMDWGVPRVAIGITSARPRFDPAELAERLRIAAIVEKRNAAMNQAIRLERMAWVGNNFGNNIALGLESLLVGTQRAKQGARVSVASVQKARRAT